MKWTLMAACVFGLAPFSSAATTLDGNRLLPKCEAAVEQMDNKRGESAEASYCLGFVNGILLMASDTSVRVEGDSHRSRLPCVPIEGLTSGQAVRVVTKYLNAHPERLHRDAHILVVEALREALPCQ